MLLFIYRLSIRAYIFLCKSIFRVRSQRILNVDVWWSFCWIAEFSTFFRILQSQGWKMEESASDVKLVLRSFAAAPLSSAGAKYWLFLFDGIWIYSAETTKNSGKFCSYQLKWHISTKESPYIYIYMCIFDRVQDGYDDPFVPCARMIIIIIILMIWAKIVPAAFPLCQDRMKAIH